MAFGNGNTRTGEFKTKTGRFAVGFGVMIDLDVDLPRKYDASTMGAFGEKGFVMVGQVVSVLGAQDVLAPAVGSAISVIVRPNDSRKGIFDDLEKTKEGGRFLLEGMTGTPDAWEARWAHGAGNNRSIQGLEIVSPPYVSFENPTPNDGPKNGYLRLNLDGAPTVFDERRSDGVYVPREFSYAEVVERLKTALDQDLNFNVRQRVLVPSGAALVDNQEGLEYALTQFRASGFTECVVRSFITGTSDVDQVDVQSLRWPENVPANEHFAGATYDMPALKETKRFVALRDGAAQASMEVVPGYMVSLLGNKDVEKSTKHKFAHNIVKGLSDKQKAMYGAQSYGPGISISAVSESGDVTGLTRLAVRTDGVQYRNLALIPTPHFVDADKMLPGGKVA